MRMHTNARMCMYTRAHATPSAGRPTMAPRLPALAPPNSKVCVRPFFPSPYLHQERMGSTYFQVRQCGFSLVHHQVGRGPHSVLPAEWSPESECAASACSHVSIACAVPATAKADFALAWPSKAFPSKASTGFRGERAKRTRAHTCVHTSSRTCLPWQQVISLDRLRRCRPSSLGRSNCSNYNIAASSGIASCMILHPSTNRQTEDRVQRCQIADWH